MRNRWIISSTLVMTKVWERFTTEERSNKPADSVFLRLYAGDKLIDTQRQKIGAHKKYALVRKLAGGPDRLSHGVRHQAWRLGNGSGKGQRPGLRRRLRHSGPVQCRSLDGPTRCPSVPQSLATQFWYAEHEQGPGPGRGLGQRPVFQRRPKSSSLPNWVLGRRAGQDPYRNSQDAHLYHQWGPGRNPD